MTLFIAVIQPAKHLPVLYFDQQLGAAQPICSVKAVTLGNLKIPAGFLVVFLMLQLCCMFTFLPAKTDPTPAAAS